MAGQIVQSQDGSRIAIDYADGEGGCVIKGQRWRWEYSDSRGYLDLTFYKIHRVRDPEDGIIYDEEQQIDFPWHITNRRCHTVWKRFKSWMKRYERRRRSAKSWQTVNC